MTEGVRFVLLTREDEEAIGSYDDFHVTGVALNDANECVSISSQYWPARYQLCGSCEGKCAWGGTVWTRPDYQNQGIFTMLFFWTKEQAGIEKTYISKNDPFNLLLADKFNLSIPENIEDLPPLGNSYPALLQAYELSGKITERFQANG
jgi:hypothetical protein